MSAEVSRSASSAPFHFRAYHATTSTATQLASVPRNSDMGAAGAKPLNGDSLAAGHTCAVRAAAAGGAGGAGSGGGAADEDVACNCAHCKEKVRLPAGQELVSGELEAAGGQQTQPQTEEVRLLHADWIELRQSLKQLYWLHMDAATAGDTPARQAAAPMQAVMKEKVARLCQRDPHQLFQRLQGQLQELTLEVKVRLLEHLSRERPGLAQLFLTALLDNYDRIVKAATSLSPAVHALEHHHLSRFGLSWVSLNKHAYHSVVYMDPMVQNNLPTFISQLRTLLSGQDQHLAYADLVRRYLSFDDEMSRAAQQWAAAEARLQEFGQEQATLKAKQRMLREDLELLRAQRKLLQQQVLSRDGVTVEEEEEALQRLVAGCTEEGCEECSLTLPDGTSGDKSRTIGLLELRQALETASRSGDGDGKQPAAGSAPAAPASSAPAAAAPATSHASTGTSPPTAAPAPAPAPPRPTACLKKSASTQVPAPPSTGCQASGSHHPTTTSSGCQAGGAHKHTYSKAAPTTHRPQPRFDPGVDPADDSSQNDSCSEQSSSTASQHCSCCYCEVFGHGVPPVAPVSRNYPEIRDRLRLRLDQRRRDHKSESSERSTGEQSAHDDTRDIGDLLQYIEAGGADQKRNEKRAAKRERQRVRRQDASAAQEEEQQQMRNIQEFQRRNPEVTITVVKSGEGETAPPPPPAADAEQDSSPSGAKRKKQQRKLAKLAAQQPAPAAAPAAPAPAPAAAPAPAPAAPPAPSEPPAPPADETSPKKSSPIMEGLARNGLVSVPTAPGAGDARMVTIRRVMEPGGREPKVTITLKGDSPEKDRVLMTLVNGQLRNGGAGEPAAGGESASEPPMTKTAKKKLKKAARLQKLKEEEEAAERARQEAEERARLEAERAAEEERQRLEQQQAKNKKKKKKKGGQQNGTATQNGHAAQPAKAAPAAASKVAPAPVVVNGKDADKWRTPKKPAAAEPERKPVAAAAAVRPAVPSAPAAGSKKRPELVAAPVTEPRRATVRPPVEPPTQLMQDLALSSSDSEIEDLARAYRIPAGITISRVRGTEPAGGAVRQPTAGDGQSPPAVSSAAADKKSKKKRKKKPGAAAVPAPVEEAVPEVTIRKVGVAPGRRSARSVDDDEAVFMPAAGGDITDLVDKEVEAFKRFCLDGPQVSREHRPKVNLNIKDILIKKKPL
ncbi:protein FAM193A-like isoform X2 [Amphibalanus amphitrite]|uniref:protein FAM193A-like isoform X2 n=1 Tax=Amphibalanus amphitrite TaxID=1232801 RepID=UPI001C909FAD|nr:protein FAM193A-like isoform X2 [Amphibalanus amphitrite]